MQRTKSLFHCNENILYTFSSSLRLSHLRWTGAQMFIIKYVGRSSVSPFLTCIFPWVLQIFTSSFNDFLRVILYSYRHTYIKKYIYTHTYTHTRTFLYCNIVLYNMYEYVYYTYICIHIPIDPSVAYHISQQSQIWVLHLCCVSSFSCNQCVTYLSWQWYNYTEVQQCRYYVVLTQFVWLFLLIILCFSFVQNILLVRYPEYLVF